MKTKNMERLLAESRKRRSDKPIEGAGAEASVKSGPAAAAPAANGLSSLVESIKRKSGPAASSQAVAEGGKKAKKQKRF